MLNVHEYVVILGMSRHCFVLVKSALK